MTNDSELDLGLLVSDLAGGFVAADALRPVAVNQRSGKAFQPGIGPHPEKETVHLVIAAAAQSQPDRYTAMELEVPYPNYRRWKCDLCLGTGPDWDWVIEIKMLRILGDNGSPNDNILMHLLSPYEKQRSALTDCGKLLDSDFRGRKAIVIYAYEAEEYRMSRAIEAFELLADHWFEIGPRESAMFDGLVHPVHSAGAVFGWELFGRREDPGS